MLKFLLIRFWPPQKFQQMHRIHKLVTSSLNIWSLASLKLGLGHFVDDYLLDFDIYHVSHVTELVMYIDAKYLSRELGKYYFTLNYLC